MEVELVSASNSKVFGKCTVSPLTTIKELKLEVQKLNKALPPNRQSFRLEPKGKAVKDDDSLRTLGVQEGAKLYVKDLGPQIGWKTVFLLEYAGPLVVYLWLYQRPWIFYGDVVAMTSSTAQVAAVCWTVHYAKRIFETLFVHRFSHSTMPLRNLFKNCSYYWLFAMYVAYHMNHPLYTSPCMLQVYTGLGLFTMCELGNFSIHYSLRNLRPAGSTVRKIPIATSNPFTFLFNWVSCPNYTYEFGAWLGFTIMTQCLPAGLFALAGMYQMTIWAIGKHKNYKKEFPTYPKNRKAILPFLL